MDDGTVTMRRRIRKPCTLRPVFVVKSHRNGVPTMGHGCVSMTGTVKHKAEVQSKSQREKLFSDMS